jgi:site-specific DNA recombinase
MIAAIYARKSTEQRDVDVEAKSVQLQIANARVFAAEKGWAVDERHVYKDDAVSGADVRKLKARQRLLDVIQRGAPFQVLIVREQSRFSRRDGDEAFAELKKIARAGVEVWFYRDRTRFSYGTFGDNILGFVKLEAAADYRRQIAAWTYEAMERKARAGHVTGGRVFGYDNVRVGGHVERRINEAEASVVRKIFQLSADGLGKTTIARRLNAEGAPAPRAQLGRPHAWAGSSVREILLRETYHGCVLWNRTKKRDVEGAIAPTNRPESEWRRVDAPALRIVDEPLWRAAHARLAQKRRSYLRGTKGQLCGRPIDGVDRKHLLVGLAKCGLCGGSIEVRSRRHGRRGPRHKFYMCANHRRRGPSVCKGVDVPMERVDQALLSTLNKQLFDPARVDRVCRDVVDHFANPATNPAARRPALLRRRGELETGISRLVDAIAAGDACSPIITAIKERERERDAIDRELAALEGHTQPIVTMETVRRVFDRLVVEWRAVLLEKSTNVALARQVMQKLVDNKIAFHPEAREEQPGYRVHVPGTLVRLAAMSLKVDESVLTVEASGGPQDGVHIGVTSPTGVATSHTTEEIAHVWGWLAA